MARGGNLGEAVLDTLRLHLRLVIDVDTRLAPDGEVVWRMQAQGQDGKVRIAEHEDYYKAACLLATMVGFELDDG